MPILHLISLIDLSMLLICLTAISWKWISIFPICLSIVEIPFLREETVVSSNLDVVTFLMLRSIATHFQVSAFVNAVTTAVYVELKSWGIISASLYLFVLSYIAWKSGINVCLSKCTNKLVRLWLLYSCKSRQYWIHELHHTKMYSGWPKYHIGPE